MVPKQTVQGQKTTDPDAREANATRVCKFMLPTLKIKMAILWPIGVGKLL